MCTSAALTACYSTVTRPSTNWHLAEWQRHLERDVVGQRRLKLTRERLKIENYQLFGFERFEIKA
jgi:hypothetical protein